MGRRWIGWALVGGLVAVLAFAPFRDNDRGRTVVGGPGLEPAVSDEAPSDSVGAGEIPTGSSGLGDSGGRGGSTTGARTTDGAGSEAEAPAPVVTVPDLPEPTDEQLAVLGPLISAMDTGQRAGTPLLLGIATSIVASGLPADSDVPPELRPVVSALAELLATPGQQVNDVTTQNSVYLAQLDRALGELAFANPSLNEVIHQTAAQLATMGRAASPVSPPGEVFLSDLSILLTFFVVD